MPICFDCGQTPDYIHTSTGYLFCGRCATANGMGQGSGWARYTPAEQR